MTAWPSRPELAAALRRARSRAPAADPRLRAVVVVPARDEHARIERCLRALSHQRGVRCGHFEVIVVLDGCVDDTAAIVARCAAARAHPRILTIELADSHGVGVARRLGMDLACERLLALGRSEGLIASTDADSVVAHDWLACQLRLARAGARAIGGRIELLAQERGSLASETLHAREHARERRMRELHAAGEPHAALEHHQFSGASLAITADTYRRCGGLPVRAALEDEALERELRARGVPIHRSTSVRVRTSARTDGRAPRGLAWDLAGADWRARCSYAAEQFPLELLLARKRETIGLVLPAREVAATIGPIFEQALRLREAGLL
ncbi:MAG TPA: glycosyltransferase, partial [Solirubrobacteraceae bacterium]|nr:glycosyltransferase [Solirubrobacteraceae bacterium]